MSAALDEVRRAIADQRGFSEDAAGFLDGTTVAELESSADRLAELIAAHRGRNEPEPEPARNIFNEARRQKAERKAELHRLFSGRPAGQPRDQAGRFTFGMDGGARPPVPVPRSPEREHGQVIAALARLRAIGGGFPGQ